jgi:adenylate cyclase
MSSESHTVERKLAAILSADVKGYSRLMGEDEVATVRTLTAYREVMRTCIHQYRGRVVDAPGDNLLAEFASVVDAVQCAVEMQRELTSRNADLPASRKMEFRVGINLGDVIVEGERIYGDGVNIAARLEGLAEAGDLCISGAVYEQIENKLALTYEYLGEQAVKNITRPVLVYRVRVAPVVAAASKLVETPRRDVSTPAQSFPDKPSIAVLPFVNLSGDQEQEYFSDGITEDLITDLSKLSGLFIISRNSVFLYKGKAVRPEQVGQELGVHYMLEGSVRKARNRVRVSAQLVDATNGYHLWADRYDRELQDIFAVQDEVTRKIVAALQVTLTEREQKRLGRTPTNNLEAYDCYLRGLEYHAHRDKEANAHARQMFERAVALDPQFAAAYAWLGRTYVLEWMYQWSESPQTLEYAFALAQRAAALDDALPGAYQTLGYVHLSQKHYEQAIMEAEKAVALDPNDADACVTLAEILSCAGSAEEAVPWAEKALRLDPHYPTSYLFALGQAYYLTGRSDKAISTFKRVLTRNPNHFRAHFFLVVLYSDLGHKDQARAEAAECQQLSPQDYLERLRQKVPYKDQALLDHWMSIVHDVWPR